MKHIRLYDTVSAFTEDYMGGVRQTLGKLYQRERKS